MRNISNFSDEGRKYIFWKYMGKLLINTVCLIFQSRNIYKYKNLRFSFKMKGYIVVYFLGEEKPPFSRCFLLILGTKTNWSTCRRTNIIKNKNNNKKINCNEDFFAVTKKTRKIRFFSFQLLLVVVVVGPHRRK